MQGDLFDSTDTQRSAAARSQRAKHKPVKVNLRVTQSGEVSVSGLSRFPITLHKGQWERLLSMSEEIREFIMIHAGELLPDD